MLSLIKNIKTSRLNQRNTLVLVSIIALLLLGVYYLKNDVPVAGKSPATVTADKIENRSSPNSVQINGDGNSVLNNSSVTSK